MEERGGLSRMSNGIRIGYSLCEKCGEKFKWIGYASKRTRISTQEPVVFEIPEHSKDEMILDYTNANLKGYIEWYCPLCGGYTKVNVNKYED